MPYENQFLRNFVAVKSCVKIVTCSITLRETCILMHMERICIGYFLLKIA